MNPKILFQAILFIISVWDSNCFRIRHLQYKQQTHRSSKLQHIIRTQTPQFTTTNHELKTLSHVATLDDPFLPATLLPNKPFLALILACIGVLVWANTRSYFQSIVKWIPFNRFLFGNRKQATTTTQQPTPTLNKQPHSSEKPKPWRPTDWGTCSLEKMDMLNDKCTLFKFRISQKNPLPAAGLGIGRKITLCSSNSQGNVVKSSFYPLSSQYSKSTFEIIVPTGANPIHTLLSSLALGDEVAFKIGKNELVYRGDEVDIKSFTLVACGAGILPVVQFLRRILSNKEFHIEQCELLWINEKRDDFLFMCNNELEKLEAEHEKVFSCARVLDTTLISSSTDLNDRIQDALPTYEDSRVALIAGPNIVNTKFSKALEAAGYPLADIIPLDI